MQQSRLRKRQVQPRARARLYLSFAQTRLLHGQTRYNVASRFVDEIPAELLKWLTPRQRGQASWMSPSSEWPTTPVALPPRHSTAPVSSRVPDHGFRIGQNVMHAKFGQGVIVSAEGSGADARLQINFGRQGMKWLALTFAKLTAV